LEQVLRREGFRVAVLRASVPALKREQWYEQQIRSGVEVVLGHPKLVETGLDLLWFPTIYFYQTGYSLHTLRQASRRSWRIGQRLDVRVKFLIYDETTQRASRAFIGVRPAKEERGALAHGICSWRAAAAVRLVRGVLIHRIARLFLGDRRSTTSSVPAIIRSSVANDAPHASTFTSPSSSFAYTGLRGVYETGGAISAARIIVQYVLSWSHS